MMNIYTICPTEYFGSNCYLVGDGDDWLVIDPSVSYEKATAKYPEITGKIKYVLLTHAHFDHIYAIDSWTKVCDTVIVGAEDAKMLSSPSRTTRRASFSSPLAKGAIIARAASLNTV